MPIERMMVGLDGNFGVLADFGWFPRPEKVGVDQHPLGQVIPDASLEKGNRYRAVLGLSCLVTHFFRRVLGPWKFPTVSIANSNSPANELQQNQAPGGSGSLKRKRASGTTPTRRTKNQIGSPFSQLHDDTLGALATFN